MTGNISKKSTTSTTRGRGSAESIPDSSYPLQQKYHLAVFQKFTALEDRLSNSLFPGKAIFHYFEDFDRLYEIYRHYSLDLIVIASTEEMDCEFEMIRQIKSHPVLQLVPTIIYVPYPEKKVIAEAFRHGVDDFLMGFWDDEINGAKIKMVCYRSTRDIGTNPSSNLPGASAIEFDVARRIKLKEDFAVCYADLDNFKAYNDYYGYVFGDKTIRMVAAIIKDIVFDLVPEGFVGHIGGDDFVFVIPGQKAVPVCRNIIETFDRMIVTKYEEADLQRGFIEVANRKGDLEKFPIMTISIAVFPYQRLKFRQLGEISHMMADLKKFTKKFDGSNYRIERRKLY